MKQFILKLRMAFCLMMSIFGFRYISVSGTSSMPDRRAKSFPSLYRCPMDVPKVFQASIDARWTCQKFSRPLSMPDGRAKSFPCLYRCPMDVPKVFQTSIDARWTCQKFSKPLSLIDRATKRFSGRMRRSFMHIAAENWQSEMSSDAANLLDFGEFGEGFEGGHVVRVESFDLVPDL